MYSDELHRHHNIMNFNGKTIPRAVAILILATVSFGTYFATLSNGFVYDDNLQVLQNLWITDVRYLPDILTTSGFAFLGKSANTYRPMLHMVFMADYHIFGLKPWGYHLINVTLHTINSILLFLTASLLFARHGASGAQPSKGAPPKDALTRVLPPFFAATLFATHPVNSEPVAWVSAIPELTFTLFLFISFHLYARALDEKAGLHRMISVVSYSLALLSKETAVSLLFLVVVYGFIRLGRSFLRAWKAYLPYLIVTAGYFALRTYAVGGVIHHKQIELPAYALGLSAFKLIAQYAGKLLLPTGLNAIYQFQAARALTDPLVMAGIFVACAYLTSIFIFRRDGAMATGLVILGVPLLPVLYIPALSSTAFADRYLYLPSAGFAMLISCALERVLSRTTAQRRWPAGAAFVAALLAVTALYSAASFKRGLVWKDDRALWEDTVVKSPDSPNAHYNLAWASEGKGDVQGAVIHYKETIRLAPDSADARYNLGIIYTRSYELDEAETEFKEALRINPGYREARERLIEIERLKGLDLAATRR